MSPGGGSRRRTGDAAKRTPASSAITRAIGGFCEARGPVGSNVVEGLPRFSGGFHGDASTSLSSRAAMYYQPACRGRKTCLPGWAAGLVPFWRGARGLSKRRRCGGRAAGGVKLHRARLRKETSPGRVAGRSCFRVRPALVREMAREEARSRQGGGMRAKLLPDTVFASSVRNPQNHRKPADGGRR